MSNNKLNRPVRSCWAKWESAQRVLRIFFFEISLCFSKLEVSLLKSLIIWDSADKSCIPLQTVADGDDNDNENDDYENENKKENELTTSKLDLLSKRFLLPRLAWCWYSCYDWDHRVHLACWYSWPLWYCSFSIKMFNTQESSYWIVCPHSAKLESNLSLLRNKL